MKRIYFILSICLSIIACIKNDIPYPTEVASITGVEADGLESVSIDEKSRKVTLHFKEYIDLTEVKIKSVTYSPSNTTISLDITQKVNLQNPVKITLHTYQDYVWELTAMQNIERRFAIEGQIGNSTIDAINHRVICQVNTSVALDDLNITDIKLGPEYISTYSPTPASIHDFRDVVSIKVTHRDVTEDWKIYVNQKTSRVELLSVNAWSKVAYLEANGIYGEKAGFRYRKSDGQWNEVSMQVEEDGHFGGSIQNLEPKSEYEVLAFCGEDQSPISKFITEPIIQLPNSGFETWSNAESGKYHSFYDPTSSDVSLQSKWWDNGNSGSTTIGAKYAITMPDTGDKVEGSASVKLASTYVLIKFAAGNIFSGQYYKTLGTSGGIIRMGRPFELRPRKLTLSLKYKCGLITKETLGEYPEGEPVKVGDKDQGIVWVALGDWDYRDYGGSEECPVEVNTTDKKTFFNRNSDAVIAYGEFVATDSTDGWIKVEIPLEYKTFTRKPTHIIVSAAASKLGDYFTGSADSILWLDDLQLEY